MSSVDIIFVWVYIGDMEKDEMLLKPKEVAVLLGISIRTVFRYLGDKSDPLPALRLSARNIRIHRDELFIWLKKHDK